MIFSVHSMPQIVFILFIFVVLFIATIILTKLTIRYAVSKNILDIPNHRSSHKTPVPKGGGIAIYLVFTAVLIGLKIWANISTQEFFALFIGGLIVAIVGWLDDQKNLPVLTRSLAYLLAVCIGIYWAGGFRGIHVGGIQLDLGFVGNIVALIAISWLINLYNFMDGIDGLAGIETLSTALIAGIFFVIENQSSLAVLCFSLATASAGFLMINWQPAKIFMGDAGSCFIGFNFGILALLGSRVGMPIYIWIILLSIFIVDSSLTLICRFISGEKWYSAHRTHAYQRLAQMGMSHRAIASSFFAINIGILGPIAYFSYRFAHLSLLLMMSVTMVLIALWFVIQWKYRNGHL